MAAELRAGYLLRAAEDGGSGPRHVDATSGERVHRPPRAATRRPARVGTVLTVAVLISLLMWAGIIALVLALVR
jgi:hypothetical protein